MVSMLQENGTSKLKIRKTKQIVKMNRLINNRDASI